MFWTATAYAMGASGQAGEGMKLVDFAPFAFMIAVFYLLLIRPQQKRTREHKEMINNLRKGDEVITGGGLCGRVVATQDDTVTLDLGETKVTIMRTYVTGLKPAPQVREKDKKSKKDAKKVDTERQPEEAESKSGESKKNNDADE